MKIIYDEAGSGKTYKLVMLSAEKNATIVARSQSHIAYIKRVANSQGVKIPEPVSFMEFMHREKFLGKVPSSFIIDDAEDFLRYVAYGVPVAATSLTKEDA